MKHYGVERISVNPTDTKERHSPIIGRGQCWTSKEAFYDAREAGFENINSGSDPWAALRTCWRCIKNNGGNQEATRQPDHSFTAKEPRKPTNGSRKNGLWTLKNTNENYGNRPSVPARGIGCSALLSLRQKNMAGNFENIGYSKPDKYGLYNILIMEEKQSIMGTWVKRRKEVHEDGRIERAG